MRYCEPDMRVNKERKAEFADVDLMLFDKLIAFDHLKQKIFLIVNVKTDNAAINYAKSLAYPYLGEKEGLRWTAEQMKQMFRNHKHERDAENGISPHTMKYARFRGRLYPYGYCGVSIL